MSRRAILGKDTDITLALTEYAERHKAILKAQEKAKKEYGVTLLNPLVYLCDTTECKSQVNGLPIYYDDDHLSQKGALLLTPLFINILNKQ